MAYVALFGIAVLFPGLMMVAGHYFPYRALSGRNLHPLARYAYGVGVIGATFTLLLFWLPEFTAIAVTVLFWACVAGAGGATFLVWMLDGFIAVQAQSIAKAQQVKSLEHSISA